jgi:hypothetical protein
LANSLANSSAAKCFPNWLLNIFLILGHFDIEGCDKWYACTEPYYGTDDDEMFIGTNKQRRQFLKSPLYESI